MVVNLLIFALAILLTFALVLHLLMKEITQQVVLGTNRQYSRRAARIGRAYKLLVWGVLSLLLFYILFKSFWLVFELYS